MKYLLVLGVLLLIGCSAGEKAASQDAMQDKNPAGAAQDKAPEKKQGIVEKAVEDAKAKLAKTFASQIEYKAAYDVTTAGQKSQMTQYFKGGNMRMDISAQGYDMRSYLLDEKFYTCNMATGSWMCQEVAYQKDATQEVQENIQEYDVTSLPPRTIAGTTTDCYLVKATQGDVEYCYSHDYVPLYIKTTAGGQVTEMIATSYSKSVSASDLELPAEPGAPVDVSKLMQGYT